MTLPYAFVETSEVVNFIYSAVKRRKMESMGNPSGVGKFASKVFKICIEAVFSHVMDVRILNQDACQL